MKAQTKISAFTLSEINIFLHQFFEQTQKFCENAAVLLKLNKNCLVDSSKLTVEISHSSSFASPSLGLLPLCSSTTIVSPRKSFRIRRSWKFASSTALQAELSQNKVYVCSDRCIYAHAFMTETIVSFVSVLRLNAYL